MKEDDEGKVVPLRSLELFSAEAEAIELRWMSLDVDPAGTDDINAARRRRMIAGMENFGEESLNGVREGREKQW